MKIKLKTNFFVPESVYTFRNIPLLNKLFLKSFLNRIYDLGYRRGFFYVMSRVGGFIYYRVGFREGVKAGLQKLLEAGILEKIKK
jgi:hypothetical protein